MINITVRGEEQHMSTDKPQLKPVYNKVKGINNLEQ
jgi:hypothetical protein